VSAGSAAKGATLSTPAAAPKVTYDLRAAEGFAAPVNTLRGQLVIPEPTAITMLQTQRFLFTRGEASGFAEAMWADSIPRLLQARLIDSFENYDIAHAPLRAADPGQADFQLVIDVRKFRIALDAVPLAEIGLSAKVVARDGKVVASRLFEETGKLDKIDPPAAVAAFDDAFARIAQNIIVWTIQAE
jgi:phospholipid/cholesterol/gamma-HCH transport system substrate-binding protein